MPSRHVNAYFPYFFGEQGGFTLFESHARPSEQALAGCRARGDHIPHPVLELRELEGFGHFLWLHGYWKTTVSDSSRPRFIRGISRLGWH